MRTINQQVNQPTKGWFNRGFWLLASGRWFVYPLFEAFSKKVPFRKYTNETLSIAHTTLPVTSNQHPATLLSNRPLTLNTILI